MWLLVWWVIHPGHAQRVHLEHYETESQCLTAEAALPDNSRHKCSEE